MTPRRSNHKRPDFAATNRVSEVQLHARNRAIIWTHSWAPTLAVGQPLQPSAVALSSINSDVNTGTISPVTPLSGSTTRRNPLLDHWAYHRKLQRTVRQPDLLNHLAKRKSVAARSAATVIEDRGRKLKKEPPTLDKLYLSAKKKKPKQKEKQVGEGHSLFLQRKNKIEKAKRKWGNHPVCSLSEIQLIQSLLFSSFRKICYAQVWPCWRCPIISLCWSTERIPRNFEKPVISGRLARGIILMTDFSSVYVIRKARRASIIDLVRTFSSQTPW